MSAKGFITVVERNIDYNGDVTRLPGLRLQIRHIIAYMPMPTYRGKEHEGCKVLMADRESYSVVESVEELDRLIEEAERTGG